MTECDKDEESRSWQLVEMNGVSGKSVLVNQLHVSLWKLPVSPGSVASNRPTQLV